jgi:hypothetical protein
MRKGGWERREWSGLQRSEGAMGMATFFDNWELKPSTKAKTGALTTELSGDKRNARVQLFSIKKN